MRGFLALLALALLAGCGGDPPLKTSRVVVDAAAKTGEASTAHIHETIKASYLGKSLGSGFSKGVVDGKKRRAALDFDLAFLSRFSRELRAADLKGGMVIDGEVAFVASESVSAKLARAGKHWVEVTADQLDDSGGPAGSLGGLGTLDPTKPVDHFRATTGEVRDLGSETIGGAPTRHYRTEMDYRLYLPLVPRRDRPPLEKSVARLDSILGTTRFPAEAWIASDGTIRRIRGTIEGKGLKMEYTIDLTGIGGPVRVRRPARSDVLDARKVDVSG